MTVPAQEYPDRIGLVSEERPPFTPYIAPETSLRELTPIPVIVGAILGLVFGASSLYLVLKVGLTVSASIPVAVISITLFRLFSPLGARDATIVEQHGILKYPEGTACAEVLKAGASAESRAAASPAAKKEQEKLGEGTSAKTIFTGFGFALAYKTAMVAFRTWKEVPEKIFGVPFKNASLSVEISPELLGVGYIIGPRIAAIMCSGGVLAYLVLIPMISYFGAGLTTPLAPEGTTLIKDMDPGAIRNAYVLYIGAGAVAMGGLVSVFRSLPTIWHGMKGGLRDFNASKAEGAPTTLRTDRDLPMRTVL